MPIRWAMLLTVGVLAGLVALGSTAARELWFRGLVAEAFEIEGPSTEPTLFNGDRVAVFKRRGAVFLPYAPVGEWVRGTPSVGDMVVASSPSDDQDILKRVIGVGGDRIELRQDEVFLNGESLRRGAPFTPTDLAGAMPPTTPVEEQREGVGDRTWSTWQRPDRIPDDFGEIVVPPGHVFLLGDHRDRSNDSRNPQVGPVPLTRIRGVASFVYFSESRSWPRWLD